DMQEAGIVAVSDDGRPVSSSSLMKKAMMYAAQFNLPVISHCEDLDLVDDGYMNEGYTSTVLGLRGNPWASETNMVSRELILAEYLNVPVHIAHVSAKLSVELIREAKARGVQVTCETCPHYFTLTEEAVGNYDTNAKVNPPLRAKEDLEAIIAGLQDGTIDCIATDHAPHHIDEKRVEFAQAANGLVGFETAFGLSYTYLVETGKLTLSQLVEKMSLNPGLILGVGTRLAEGECADITVVDLNQEYTVEVAKFLSKSKNSPYDGWKLKGSVVHTIVDGRI
ncbi:MAG: dihydroorotase, partial [Clostridia bacterium]|nr:dihydroorotase [Clostridia bacterium]